MKQRLRPQRSVSLLHGIMKIAMISRNSVIVACTPVTVVFRSSLMSVIITFMFEPAKLQMNCASARGRINLRGDIPARPETRAPLAGAALSVSAVHPRNARKTLHSDAFSHEDMRPKGWLAGWHSPGPVFLTPDKGARL